MSSSDTKYTTLPIVESQSTKCWASFTFTNQHESKMIPRLRLGFPTGNTILQCLFFFGLSYRILSKQTLPFLIPPELFKVILEQKDFSRTSFQTFYVHLGVIGICQNDFWIISQCGWRGNAPFSPVPTYVVNYRNGGIKWPYFVT